MGSATLIQGREGAKGDEQLIKTEAVEEIVGLSGKSLSRMVKAGKMPKPLTVGGSRRWRRSDIQGWIAAGCPAQ